MEKARAPLDALYQLRKNCRPITLYGVAEAQLLGNHFLLLAAGRNQASREADKAQVEKSLSPLANTPYAIEGAPNAMGVNRQP
jgi:hypothetical protein